VHRAKGAERGGGGFQDVAGGGAEDVIPRGRGDADNRGPLKQRDEQRAGEIQPMQATMEGSGKGHGQEKADDSSDRTKLLNEKK